MTPAASITATIVAAERPTGLPTRAVANALIWLTVFFGGFVFFEPAPYELFLALLIPAWLLLGLRVPHAVGPLVVLMLVFVVGGVLAATQARDFDTQPIYYAVTAFLALSSCFFACLIYEDARRLDVIVGAWIATALVTTALGVAGYLGLTGELFVKFGRASGGFQDPNVFGPFLILPFVVLVHRGLTRPLGSALFNAVLALVLLLGLFLSFSRSAWGLVAITLMMMVSLIFLTERSDSARVRVVVLSILGATVSALLIAAALTIPAVADLFQDRIQITQEYDVGHLGRFQRYQIGFNMALEHPLGIGAIEFGRQFGEDEHNIWLKCLTTYGWLGFAAFLTLVVWTLVAAFPLMFKSGPLKPIIQISYIVFLGHIVIGTVIDIDHWRHVFLLFGLLWGAIAADSRRTQALFAAYAAHRSRMIQRH